MTFQRARNDEQREVRRRAILNTAAAMLAEMPVSAVSLNELSRRAGLAKSALSRYFESREAVLLELLDDYLGSWLAVLPSELADSVDSGAQEQRRAQQLADVLSESLAARPVLCDLFGSQGAVLEQKVSAQVVLRHKRASLHALTTMTDVIRTRVPELGEGTHAFCLHVLILAGAISSYCPPPSAVEAVYRTDPSLAVVDIDFRNALRGGIESALLGHLPRD